MAKKKWNKKSRTLKKNSDINISEAVVRVAQSFLGNNNAESFEDFELILQLTVIAWNHSVYLGMEDEKLDVLIKAFLSDSFDDEDKEGLIETIKLIMAEKEKLYPDIRRVINKHDIVNDNGRIKIDVQSVPVEIEVSSIFQQALENSVTA